MLQILVVLAFCLLGSLADPCYREYDYDKTVDGREFGGRWTISHANFDDGPCPRAEYRFRRNYKNYNIDLAKKENNTFMVFSGTGKLKNGFFRVNFPTMPGNYRNFVILDHDEGFKEFFVFMNCYEENGETIRRTKVFIRKGVNASNVYENIKPLERSLNVTYLALPISDTDCLGNPIPA